tara:strand:- start:154 stop:711 length:558 start_codon:yes stop_codon:yes gene_type:complete
MFTIPHAIYPAPDNFAEYKKKLLKIFDEDTKYKHNLGREIKTDYFYNDDNASLPSYCSLVEEALSPYLQQTEKSMGFKLQIRAMWYQQSIKGQAHGVHNHGATGFSAVWYVEFDPNEHTATTFYAPFNDIFSGDPVHCIPKIKEGDLVIFPSFMLHEQLKNSSNKRRTIVSFNIKGHTSQRRDWK